MTKKSGWNLFHLIPTLFFKLHLREYIFQVMCYLPIIITVHTCFKNVSVNHNQKSMKERDEKVLLMLPIIS